MAVISSMDIIESCVSQTQMPLLKWSIEYGIQCKEKDITKQKELCLK